VIRLPVESFRRAAQLDPERAAILTAMGIRQQHALASVPLALIQAWQAALEHPGMAARFDNPVALAVVQLRREIGPPSDRELERWAGGGRLPQCDNDRHYAPIVFDEAKQAALLARAQAIAGDGDDLLVGFVATALADGMDEIGALIHAQREVERGAVVPVPDEEVYRALRARSRR
jgi:hypothetical protein